MAKIVDQGAERYAAGEILPFDRKNKIFKRPLWDPTMRDLGQKFYFDRISLKNTPVTLCTIRPSSMRPGASRMNTPKGVGG